MRDFYDDNAIVDEEVEFDDPYDSLGLAALNELDDADLAAELERVAMEQERSIAFNDEVNDGCNG